MRNKKSLFQNLFSKHSQYSWRSLFSFVSLVTISTILLCLDKIQSQDWVSVIQWLASSFIAGETVKKFMPTQEAQEISDKE